MEGRLNLDGGTLNLDGGMRPPRPLYNLSTGYHAITVKKNLDYSLGNETILRKKFVKYKGKTK